MYSKTSYKINIKIRKKNKKMNYFASMTIRPIVSASK